MMLKRIYRLLLPAERKQGGKVAGAVFLTALLDFVGLAALLPVLYYLLDGGENRQAALWFSLLAVGVVLFKSALVIGFSRYQNRYLLSLYGILNQTHHARTVMQRHLIIQHNHIRNML